MADTKTLNASRAAFMRRASAPDINALALKLAYLIAFKHMDTETGKTTLRSQETLARDLNVTVRTVQRLLDILIPLGLVIVPGHGPGRAATYWIDPDKATPVSPINTTPVSPIGGRKGDTRRPNTRHLTTKYTTPVSPPLKKNLQEDSPRKEDIYPAPGFASPDIGEDTTPKIENEKPCDDDNVTRFSDADLAAAFAEFWSACLLKVAPVKTRRAHRIAVVKRGVAPARLTAAMKRHAAIQRDAAERAMRAGKEPPYIKHPANWIIDGCYDDEIASTAPPTIDEHGNVIEPPASSPPSTWDEIEANALAKDAAHGGKWGHE
ncbi:helix-turn-helix domain-containing protein [Bradyrhizobium barranii subsp. barranii]|uniref:Helix-turn-helix domain-containing protein n=1 Tax=Bradyrhizobium barranii subsp. barranii TaxID=2823807 RepID=A0A7Z0TJI6_9BRAD|nr:helix-turn-helix domain-containing protein [Bradyrhizobium barranii]UGX95794.1 helix-turn-helix domain-containing protein [Bradyrhizobium barranii subsp. barranii]